MGQFIQLIITLIIIPILLLILWRIRLKRLAVYHSKILGKIEVLEKYNGERLMAFNNYAQGISPDKKNIELSYWYGVAKQVLLFCKDKKDPQVLMFGMGACTIPNLISEKNSGINQTIVEFDPLVVKACEDFFGLKNIPNCKVVLADAYDLIKKKDAFGKKFDCIISDIFVGKPPFAVKKSTKPDFITQVLKYLKYDGAIIFNWPAHTDEFRNDGLKLEKYLAILFKETEIIHVKDPRGYKNNIIVGRFLLVN